MKHLRKMYDIYLVMNVISEEKEEIVMIFQGIDEAKSFVLKEKGREYKIIGMDFNKETKTLLYKNWN